MRTYRGLIAVMFMLTLPLLVGNAYGESRYRWDLIRVSVSNGTVTIRAGGTGAALAQDGSMLTITGSGTFTVGDDDVTGGGAWTTVAADGITVTGTGNYLVTRLIRFVVAPGHLPSTFHDTIGDVTQTHAGLAYLGIAYDDGSKGILIVSCAAPGAPASMFEGITASKGFVDYWNRVAHNTLFHLLREQEEEN